MKAIRMSACLKYEVGVVLSLERHQSPPPGLSKNAICPNVGLSIAGETTYFPEARAALRRIITAPGEEERTLRRLAERPEVLSVSLNYLASRCSKTADLDQAMDVPAAWRKRYASVPMTEAVWFWSNEQKQQRLFSNGIAEPLPRPSRQRKSEPKAVAIIDAELSHSCQVAQSVQVGYSRLEKQGKVPQVLVLTLCVDALSAFSLWTYCNLLLALSGYSDPLTVIGMAVDLGELCADLRTLGQPGTPWVTSLDLFETCLDIFLNVRNLRSSNSSPVLVAAAGNRLGDSNARFRLAYPASLPDVIPATSARVNRELAALSEKVEIPTPGSLKPCFGIAPASHDDADFFESTSQATGLLSGAIAALERRFDGRDGRRGQFAKLAQLLSLSRSYPIRIGKRKAATWPPRLNVRQLDGESQGDRKTNEIEQLLIHLFEQFGREFLLFGSAAFVDRWLREHDHYEKANWQQGFALIGDLDVLYTGPRSGSHAHHVQQTVDNWFERKRPPDQCAILPRPVQLRHLREWPGRLLWLQCIVPAAQLAVTTHGQIDPWEKQGAATKLVKLDIHVPPPAVWEANPQWWPGQAGVLDGALVALNLAVLTMRLKQEFRKDANHTTFHELTADFSDPASLLQGIDESEYTWSDLWFGRGSREPGPWAQRRIKKIRQSIDQVQADSEKSTALELLASFERGPAPSSKRRHHEQVEKQAKS
jgi:hypothetical protein